MSTSANERRLVQPLAPVLSAEEVTELLGLSPPTLRRLVKDGHLRAHRLPGGRKWVFRADEVLESVGSWPAGDDGEGEHDRLAGPVPVPDQIEHPLSDDQPAVDAANVWCPAPPKSEDSAAHAQQCAAAWLDAAQRAGLAASLVGSTLVDVGGSAYELRVGPRERVLVVDDDGEEAWQLIDAVWVESVKASTGS